ncbi:hypothetical protein [Crassaminicella indica]|uniref:Mobile element protein n=1 Tax=Crassaminicella indica TaxID=2855394 RepID=A0ABX8R918_9CLOT|nr:hypothetical protein [Crassaminicella indica]QXM05508.1 hypothetical protein KVH43_08985 [Crassaminicella indica]
MKFVGLDAGYFTTPICKGLNDRNIQGAIGNISVIKIIALSVHIKKNAYSMAMKLELCIGKI